MISLHSSRIVNLGYGYYILRKALNCKEKQVCLLLVVLELLRGDPATTLVNKHASHVWSKVMQLMYLPIHPVFGWIRVHLFF
jgi:hypothetical protein